jgi:hypothetical protein
MRVIALDLLANTLNIQSSPERAARTAKVLEL